MHHKKVQTESDKEFCVMAPCPNCGEAKDIARKLWGCYLNYCNVCATLYDVPPGKDASQLWREKQKKKRGRKRR